MKLDSVNDTSSASSSTETLFRLLLPSSDKFHEMGLSQYYPKNLKDVPTNALAILVNSKVRRKQNPPAFDSTSWSTRPWEVAEHAPAQALFVTVCDVLFPQAVEMGQNMTQRVKWGQIQMQTMVAQDSDVHVKLALGKGGPLKGDALMSAL